jgi:Tfp pilus assembly protein PilZ
MKVLAIFKLEDISDIYENMLIFKDGPIFIFTDYKYQVDKDRIIIFKELK